MIENIHVKVSLTKHSIVLGENGVSGPLNGVILKNTNTQTATRISVYCSNVKG